jgi:hypothetical protein
MIMDSKELISEVHFLKFIQKFLYYSKSSKTINYVWKLSARFGVDIYIIFALVVQLPQRKKWASLSKFEEVCSL